jgi:hypothetical protein
MPLAGFEPTIPVFKRAKTFHAFDRAATVTGVIATLKRYKSPDIDKIPAELIQAGGETLHSQICKLIYSVWNKEELPDQWMSLTVPIHRNGD